MLLATLTLPFNLKRDIGVLSSIGRYGVLILIYIVLVLMIQAPFYAAQPSVTYTAATADLTSMLGSWGNFIYSFNCIVNVFAVKTSLKPLTRDRLASTFSTTILILYFFYSLIGLTGYISLGDAVRDVDLIIERSSIRGSSDIAMRIGIARNLISDRLPSSRGIHRPCHSDHDSVHRTL